MVRKLLVSIVATFFLMCAAATHADTVTASGAGTLPGTAEDLTGMNVTQILGSLPDPLGTDPLGVNMFKITITDFTDFSAETVNAGSFGIPDTILFLFDASGMAVEANDDIDGGNTLSLLPAGSGPTSNGTYFLAITRSQQSPLDMDGNELFTIFNSTDVVGPNSGVGPVAGWDGGVFTNPDFDLQDYDIMLTGTSPGAAPEPATWALIGVGFLALLFRRNQLARS